jgi:hypothetical protein
MNNSKVAPWRDSVESTTLAEEILIPNQSKSERSAAWRQSAAKLRVFADQFSDLSQDNLLHLAKQWDYLADQLEGRKPVTPFL